MPRAAKQAALATPREARCHHVTRCYLRGFVYEAGSESCMVAGDTQEAMVFATRLSPRVRRSLRRLDDGTRPIAELNRLLGGETERSGGMRPSYEQVRQAVHAARLERTRDLAHIVVEVRVLPAEGTTK